jgi:hypothetical protein
MFQFRLSRSSKSKVLYHLSTLPLKAFLKCVTVWRFVQAPPCLLLITFCNNSVAELLYSLESLKNVGKIANWALVVVNLRACWIFSAIAKFVSIYVFVASL